MSMLLAVADVWGACAYLALGLVGAVGLMALVSPRRFSAIAGRGQAIELHWATASRLLGGGLLVGVLLAGYMIARL